MSDEEQLPDWAARKSDGDYMVPMTQLCTKDGRRIGNAVVLLVDHGYAHGSLATIQTDAGTEFRMVRSELEELFHPPLYVMNRTPAQDRKYDLD